MRFTITFLESEYERMSGLLRSTPELENAAFALCKLARTSDETRLLVREIIPIPAADVLEASPIHMRIHPRAYTRAMKQADDKASSLVFIHSHPTGFPRHSDQDDKEEA